MDLNSYLLSQVVEATTPPNETAAAARSRSDAIVEMVCAFDPRDGMEAMIACHCVMLQFLLNAAMREASDIGLPLSIVAKNSARVMGISRTLRQWVGQFDKARKRNEIRAKEATLAQAAAVDPVTVQSAPEKSPEASVAPARSPAIRAPGLNGGAAAVAPSEVLQSALAAGLRPGGQGSIAAGEQRAVP